MKKIKIKINGQEVVCPSEDNIWQAAKGAGIIIPGLCGHPDFTHKANCRICVVEVKGCDKLITSCSTKVSAGMEIITDSDRIKKARNLNIELLFAEHIEKCATCIWRVNCKLLDLADKYKIHITAFKDRKGDRRTYKFANAVEIDGTQCIDCRNCIDACSKMQKIDYLEIKGKGIDQEIVPIKNKNKDCIYCGQCAVHCPVGSAQEQSGWDMVEKVIKNKKSFINFSGRIIVAQLSPVVGVSLAEEFGLECGQDTTGQIITGLRELGFDYVYNASINNDIASLLEVKELLNNIKKRYAKPLLTASCPAWVKYVEFYYPKFAANLSKVKSPQIIGGLAIKNYLAKKLNINSKNIVVVTIAPCTAQKYEASRKDLKVKNQWPVDYVITTRELAWLFKKNKIDFPKLKESQADKLINNAGGVNIIYEATGGISVAAINAIAYLSRSKKNAILTEEIKNLTGLSGFKSANIKIAGKNVKVGVVNGIGNIDDILRDLGNYDYIEVRACPAGCVGGGGQPITTTPLSRKIRTLSLHKISKKNRINKFKNTKEILNWLKKQDAIDEQEFYIKK